MSFLLTSFVVIIITVKYFFETRRNGENAPDNTLSDLELNEEDDANNRDSDEYDDNGNGNDDIDATRRILNNPSLALLLLIVPR